MAALKEVQAGKGEEMAVKVVSVSKFRFRR
jgi:hypothetical protein